MGPQTPLSTDNVSTNDSSAFQDMHERGRTAEHGGMQAVASMEDTFLPQFKKKTMSI